MIDRDVVAELDAWIANCPEPSLIRRARDEIVALRKALNSLPRTDIMGYERSIRAEALEEAANVADDACLGSSCRAIHAIRALKDRP